MQAIILYSPTFPPTPEGLSFAILPSATLADERASRAVCEGAGFVAVYDRDSGSLDREYTRINNDAQCAYIADRPGRCTRHKPAYGSPVSPFPSLRGWAEFALGPDLSERFRAELVPIVRSGIADPNDVAHVLATQFAALLDSREVTHAQAAGRVALTEAILTSL